MNGLDVAIVVAGGIGVLSGLGRGVLRMITSIVALAAAIYFASIYYPAARDITLRYVPVTPTLAAVIGYAIVFLIVLIIVQTAGSILMRLVRTASLGWVDRLLGGAVGGAIALALIGLLLMMMTAALPTDTALLKQSQLAPPVLQYTDALIAYIPPEVKTIYQRKRAELMRYWLRQSLEPHESPSASSTP
ncbi:MAG TPA: CvpA family protein [Candidatus Binataceae bacterium]|nr:CvpA family protein [Candidatus Binataceae bacterium]